MPPRGSNQAPPGKAARERWDTVMSEELLERRPVVPRRERPLTQEEVLKRNSVERMKLEKHPFDVIHDIPRFIEMPYEDIPEEDILRMQWWGLYHDKPKIG